MKIMTRGILFLSVSLAASALYGGEPARGVAGVDVSVKQNPGKRVMTDGRGNFAIDALPAGSYTLTFQARKSQETKSQTPSKVTIATSYSIKIDGTKRSVNKSGLTSSDLMAGYDVKVDLGAGAKIRGQVAAGAFKKMVWVPKEPGSNIPGHWAEAGTVAASASNSQTHSRDDMRDTMNRANSNMSDPRPESGQVQLGPR